jgi:hypothetical protein
MGEHGRETLRVKDINWDRVVTSLLA